MIRRAESSHEPQMAARYLSFAHAYRAMMRATMAITKILPKSGMRRKTKKTIQSITLKAR